MGASLRNPSRKFLILLVCFPIAALSQNRLDTIYSNAWAGNSINTVIFRKNALTSNQTWQFTSFYDSAGCVIVGRRALGTRLWTWKKLQYRGQIRDAHNAISIQLDGLGFLHLAWDHHNTALKYLRSQSPGSLEFEPLQNMTGSDESAVSYPEFYKLPDGNLLCLYRNGSSGDGNLVINRYDIKTAAWTRLHHNLLDGEGQRNAYWQAAIDRKGYIHLSWTWRETPDVASNHDICYAFSTDQGKTWKKSNGKTYQLPITAKSAEYIKRIPQNSELINQTSMTCDEYGRPVIASYWKEQGDVPQYHVIYLKAKKWFARSLGFRSLDFSLSGMGTRSIPISRPQIITWTSKNQTQLGLIFRDEERGNKPSIALNSIAGNKSWSVEDLNDLMLNRWEPCVDQDLWASSRVLNLFIQQVDQLDGEQVKSSWTSPISILEWRPKP